MEGVETDPRTTASPAAGKTLEGWTGGARSHFLYSAHGHPMGTLAQELSAQVHRDDVRGHGVFPNFRSGVYR